MEHVKATGMHNAFSTAGLAFSSVDVGKAFGESLSRLQLGKFNTWAR
jgi:hypothetical protein